MGFTKLDDGIIRSSLWDHPDYVIRTWITFLASKDEKGFVRGTMGSIQRITNIYGDKDGELFKKAIDILESPDENSATTENDGRRIERVPGGWVVLNHFKYRDKDYRIGADSNGEKIGYVYFAGNHDRVKIGFSANPWSRIESLKCSNPDMELYCAIKGDMKLEKKYHEKYSYCNVGREWFELNNEIIEEIKSISGKVVTTGSYGSKLPSVSVSDSVSISEKEIEEIYLMYPTTDKNKDNQSTGKTSKNKQKIKKILESKYPLKKAIEFYLSECNRTKCYLKNFGTFLNNLPDESLITNQDPPKKKNTDFKFISPYDMEK